MLEKTNSYIKRAYETACKHGFHEEKLSSIHFLMLAVTEVSEAVEADRKNRYARIPENKKDTYFDPCCFHTENVNFVITFELFVKDCVEDELADICIRLYDIAGMMGISYDAEQVPLNIPRGLTFTEKAYMLTGILTEDKDELSNVKVKIAVALEFIESWAKELSIDLEWHIEAKMMYNSTREYKHAKRY